MADVTPARVNVQDEETDFRSALSEALFKKVGGSINFINDKQYDKHAWNLNGPYALGVGSMVDGIFPFLFDVELTGFWYYIDDVGTGTTTIDIHKLSSGGTSDDGTIFSVLPSVNGTAANGTYTLYDQVNSTTIANPTGHTLAVLSTINFDAGEALRLDLDAAQTDSNNFQMGIMFRPR